MNTLNWIESKFPNRALSRNHAFVDFGIMDQKGRNIGCRLEIINGEIDFSETLGVDLAYFAAENVKVCPITNQKFITEYAGKTYRMPSRKKFTVYAHATRNEKLFGGSSAGGIECETLEQAQAAAMDLAEKMRRRYVAKSKA